MEFSVCTCGFQALYELWHPYNVYFPKQESIKSFVNQCKLFKLDITLSYFPSCNGNYINYPACLG